MISSGLFMALASPVFIIMFFVLYVRFIGRGIELLILRIGAPFVCVGLLDSDKGVFTAYAPKLLQTSLTHDPTLHGQDGRFAAAERVILILGKKHTKICEDFWLLPRSRKEATLRDTPSA